MCLCCVFRGDVSAPLLSSIPDFSPLEPLIHLLKIFFPLVKAINPFLPPLDTLKPTICSAISL